MEGSALTKDIYLLLIHRYLYPRDGWVLAHTCKKLMAAFGPLVLKQMRAGIALETALKHARPLQRQYRPVPSGYYRCELCFDSVKLSRRDRHVRRCDQKPWEQCHMCELRDHGMDDCVFLLVTCSKCHQQGPLALVERLYSGCEATRRTKQIGGGVTGCFRCGIVVIEEEPWGMSILPWKMADEIHLTWETFE